MNDIAQKVPQKLKGFRDFSGKEKKLRDWVKAQAVKVFTVFNFAPLETPTMEYASLLLDKYGDEADKLVYKFMDRGEREIALRYDQTVPTARFLAENNNQLPRYFRRYQIQNVFRADKPQAGRYREFTQCDADIFGSKTAVADAEILAVTYKFMEAVGLADAIVQVNSRIFLEQKISEFVKDFPAGLASAGIILSIDKIDKIAAAGVSAELQEKGLSAEVANKLLEGLTSAEVPNDVAEIIEATVALGVPRTQIEFTPSLARGLDYYTGMIFEVICPRFGVGSLAGGGRYDKMLNELAGIDIPAVGVGIGFDRTIEALKSLDLMPAELSNTKSVLVANFDEACLDYVLDTTFDIRKTGTSAEIFVDGSRKLGDQIKYALDNGFSYVVVAGSHEVLAGNVQIKDLSKSQREEGATTEIKKEELKNFF